MMAGQSGAALGGHRPQRRGCSSWDTAGAVHAFCWTAITGGNAAGQPPPRPFATQGDQA
jgi:hypothetical protein